MVSLPVLAGFAHEMHLAGGLAGLEHPKWPHSYV